MVIRKVAEKLDYAKRERQALAQAHECFKAAVAPLAKASDRYPEDADLDTAYTHLAAGLGHMSKIDFEGQPVEGQMGEIAIPAAAEAPAEAALAAELRKHGNAIMRKVHRQLAYRALDKADRMHVGNAMPAVVLKAIDIAHKNPLAIGPDGMRELNGIEDAGGDELKDLRPGSVKALNAAVEAIRRHPAVLAVRGQSRI